MSWSPTARRNGISGVAHLFRREEWRLSEHGPVLERIMRSALEADDRVARLHAAHVIQLLEPDPQRALPLIRRRLLVEPEGHVAAVLTNELHAIARRLPAEVDALLGNLAVASLWQTRLASRDRGSDAAQALVSLNLYLAIAHETTTASDLAGRWFSRPTEGPVAQRVFWLLRPWLSLPRVRSEERHRAFVLVSTAARALDSLRLMNEASNATDIYQIAGELVDAIYFASGAFGTEETNREPLPAEEGFAKEAFPILDLLREFKHPSIVHRIVETLGHLSSSDPRRAFLLVERSISAGDAYTFDMLAAATSIGLIERYLAEYRDVVATDPDVLTAVRRVLDAFVRVGWPAAISLSYRLGDAFR